MNTRGQYSSIGGHRPYVRTHVGSRLVHTLELQQRYNNVKTDGVAILLRELAKGGTVSQGSASTPGSRSWQVALKEGAWVLFTWYPDHAALEVTITDRETRPVEQTASTRDRYEAILRKISPLLQTYGASVVGASTYVGQQVAAEPRFAARTRAIRAVFDMYTRQRVPYYLYAEVNGTPDKRTSSSLDEANAIFAAFERSPGEVYVAIFDPTDPLWPGPALDVFHALPQTPQPFIGGYADVYLGQGSIIPHTPGETEDELKQLHGEIMAFGQEAIELINPIEKQSMGRVQKLRDDELAAHKVVESFAPLVDEVYRLEKLLIAAGVPKKITAEWREQPPPYDNIRSAKVAKKAEALKAQFVAAKEALDKFMPRAERHAAVKRARDASGERSMAQAEKMSEHPLVKWKASVWRPFFDGWQGFYHQKIDIPMQMLPGSGTWDRIQEYRKQFIDLRNKAPFKAQGPAPLDPSGRSDPSLTGGLRDIWGGAGNVLGIVKWGLIGALGIGAVVALSSVVSNVRKGKDPAEKYVEMIREGRRPRKSSSRALPQRGQRALPAGSEDEGA